MPCVQASAALYDISRSVLRALVSAPVGCVEEFDKLLDQTPDGTSLLQVNHYKRIADSAGADNCVCHAWHVDKSLLSVVWYAEYHEGLEVSRFSWIADCETTMDSLATAGGCALALHMQVKAIGGHEHKVPNGRGCHVVVLPGLTLQLALHGSVRATEHRAVYTALGSSSICFKLSLAPEALLTSALLGIKTMTVADAYAGLDMPAAGMTNLVENKT